jgi:hypothetical protein
MPFGTVTLQAIGAVDDCSGMASLLVASNTNNTEVRQIVLMTTTYFF